MKKKIGPLPLWTWIVVVGGVIGIYLLYRSNSSSSSTTANANTVDPSSPTGLTYGEEAQDAASGIDPATGETYAAEQAANSASDGTSGGGSSGGDTSSGTDDTAALAQVDSDLNNGFMTLSTQLASGQGLTDQATPEQTFAGEVGDVTAGISALQALTATLSPTPATASSKPAPALGAGAIRAAFGATKPAAKSGYTIVGQGNGYWEYVPIAKTTVKSTQVAPKPTGPAKAEPKSTVKSGKK